MNNKKRIIVSDQGLISVVRFVDKKIVDSASIESLGEELNSLVTDEKRDALLLNFEGVEFMSSAALNKLISLNSKVKSIQGRLKFCNVKADIREVFTITRLDRVFDIRNSEADAIAAFRT
jgi:anti-sigma B factor antagonist